MHVHDLIYNCSVFISIYLYKIYIFMTYIIIYSNIATTYLWYFDVNTDVAAHIGLYAHGQVGFLSGTTINCYEEDSTCSSVSTDTTLNYDDSGVYQFNTDSANPCCFTEENGSLTLHLSYYYSVDGGICQSCRGNFINSVTKWLIIKYCLELTVHLAN